MILKKEYKLVELNKGLDFSRKKDIVQAEDVINESVSAGWKLQQTFSPSNAMGFMIDVSFREKSECKER